jgi:hypothetical protein
LNTAFRLFSLRETSTGTDYGNIFFTQSLQGSLYKWRIGLSATNTTTPDVSSTGYFSSGRGGTFTTSNIMLIVLKHSEITDKLTLYVFQNYNGEMSDTLVPNVEPTTPICEVTLSTNIVPTVITFSSFLNVFMSGYVSGNRISTFWDIKF